MLFLDEPTSGLDSTTATSLCATLRSIAVKKRMTIVAVIHQVYIFMCLCVHAFVCVFVYVCATATIAVSSSASLATVAPLASQPSLTSFLEFDDLLLLGKGMWVFGDALL